MPLAFFISLFLAQHVSDVNTSILRSLRLICWVISWVVLLWYDVCWCYVVVWLVVVWYPDAGWSIASLHPSSVVCDLFVELCHGLYCSGRMHVGVTLWFGWGGVVSGCRLKHCFTASILSSLRFICWVMSWVVLLWYDACWCYGVVWLGWCGIRIPHHTSQTTTYHQHTSNQSNTTHDITQQISRKLLRMDVLTSETCWAVNNEIIKQVTSSCSLFIQNNNISFLLLNF